MAFEFDHKGGVRGELLPQGLISDHLGKGRGPDCNYAFVQMKGLLLVDDDLEVRADLVVIDAYESRSQAFVG